MHLLPIRAVGEDIPPVQVITSFEERLGAKLPPVWKAFLKNFAVPFYVIDIKEKYGIFTDESMSLFLPYDFSFLIEGASKYISRYFDLKEVESCIYDSFPEEFKPSIENGFLPVARFEVDGYLFVGFFPQNEDKIYFFDPFDFTAENPGCLLLAENILDFLRNLPVKIADKWYFERENIEMKNLYKKWGESIWRVKP